MSKIYAFRFSLSEPETGSCAYENTFAIVGRVSHGAHGPYFATEAVYDWHAHSVGDPIDYLTHAHPWFSVLGEMVRMAAQNDRALIAAAQAIRPVRPPRLYEMEPVGGVQ